VEHAMDEMWLLPEDRGVLWKSGASDVLFFYKKFEYSLGGNAGILDAIAGRLYQGSQSLSANLLGIYLISRK
jgi:hypothetical protein